MSGPGRTVEELWIERVSARTGFDRISELLLGRAGGGPYLLVLCVVLVHIPVLSAIGWLQTGTLSMAVNPGELFQIPAWLAVTWIVLRTKRCYAETIAELPEPLDGNVSELATGRPLLHRLLTALGVPENPRSKAEAGFETIVPARVTATLLFVGWVFYGIQLLTNTAALIGPVVELTGETVAAIRFYLIVPLALYPIGVEFLSVVIGSLVLLPVKIRRVNVIDFSDPHRFGSLTPAGELFKNVSVSYFVLLTLFTSFQTVARGASPTTLFSSTLILGGLVVGLLLFFSPMMIVRGHVRDAKNAEIAAIAEEIELIGNTDDGIPYATPESAADASQYVYNHIRITQIEMTSEIPLNVGMLREMLFALVLPYASARAFDYVLGLVP